MRSPAGLDNARKHHFGVQSPRLAESQNWPAFAEFRFRRRHGHRRRRLARATIRRFFHSGDQIWERLRLCDSARLRVMVSDHPLAFLPNWMQIPGIHLIAFTSASWPGINRRAVRIAPSHEPTMGYPFQSSLRSLRFSSCLRQVAPTLSSLFRFPARSNVASICALPQTRLSLARRDPALLSWRATQAWKHSAAWKRRTGGTP